jgi:hypothetical protein
LSGGRCALGDDSQVDGITVRILAGTLPVQRVSLIAHGVVFVVMGHGRHGAAAAPNVLTGPVAGRPGAT